MQRFIFKEISRNIARQPGKVDERKIRTTPATDEKDAVNDARTRQVAGAEKHHQRIDHVVEATLDDIDSLVEEVESGEADTLLTIQALGELALVA